MFTENEKIRIWYSGYNSVTEDFQIGYAEMNLTVEEWIDAFKNPWWVGTMIFIIIAFAYIIMKSI